MPAARIHHLRMIARESVTNAVRHARAANIVIQIVVDNAVLALRISDDGCGFDAGSDTCGRTGHFGCVGIRERTRKLGATVAWHSAPGHGTTVEVLLPLARSGSGAMANPPPSSLASV